MRDCPQCELVMPGPGAILRPFALQNDDEKVVGRWAMSRRESRIQRRTDPAGKVGIVMYC